MMKKEVSSQGHLLGITAWPGAAQPPSLQRKITQMIRRILYAMVLLGLSFSACRASADDAALIDALVRKGVLDQKEAEIDSG